jgi:hypothetical protein
VSSVCWGWREEEYPFWQTACQLGFMQHTRGDIQESRSESFLSQKHQNLSSLPKRQNPYPRTRTNKKDIIRTSKYIYQSALSFKRDVQRGRPSLAILVPIMKVWSKAPTVPLCAFLQIWGTQNPYSAKRKNGTTEGRNAIWRNMKNMMIPPITACQRLGTEVEEDIRLMAG